MKGLGVRTLNLEDDLLPGLSGAATTQSLITDADLVCAALRETNSPNVYVELGYALGLRRPTLVISEAPSLPIDLAEILWIKAPLDDRAALTFQLRAALANIDSLRPRRRRLRPTIPSQRKPLSQKLTSSRAPGSDLERDLLTALEASPEIELITPQPQVIGERVYIPDFAVWFAASAQTLDSPVMVIELKSTPLSPGASERAVEQLQTYARLGDIKSGLLIHCDPGDSDVKVLSLTPLTFAVGFDEVRRLLAEGRFLERLRRERNRFAHSAG